MVERRTKAMRRRHWLFAMSIAIGVAGASWPKAQSPLFAWNVSQSVPVGLYLIAARQPSRGELAALRLPEAIRSLADDRGYLQSRAVLMKPVAALAGDTVCRHGAIITINGDPAAHALFADTMGRPLPQWNGCQNLDDQQLFVLSKIQHSFDGRYFGLVDARHVIGTAASVIVAAVLPSATPQK